MLFGCYRKGDANDPETYVAAVAAILSEYPEDVIQRVTDPRTGYARKHKFMPNVCEISEECDLAKEYLENEKIVHRNGWRWRDNKWQKEA